MSQRLELEQAIAHLEGQRQTLGEAVTDTAIAALREKLAALAAAETPASQRKQITVLFADVSGFTALSEKLDAEDVTALMNELWGQLDAIITAHGGLIDKHMGDAVMALWGAEQAREDDPERAIQAGLAIQQVLKAWHPAGEAGVAQLTLRIGINTGPVLLGSIATTQEFTAMGDTVNLAARLQTLAPAGGVLISHDTYRHVRGLFEVKSLTPMDVRGKHEPVQTYLVGQARPRAFHLTLRGVEGVETRLVGRQAELESLQAAFCRVVEQSQTQCLTLTGEAGVGKSRLIYEFQLWLELQGRALRLTGRASQEMQRQPYALLRDMLATRCQIQDSDTLAMVGEKLTDELGTEAAVFIGQLLGYDFSDHPYLRSLRDPQQLRERALLELGGYLRRLAAQQPLVLLLEDIHWADDSSLDALRQALPNAGPLLLAAAARPALFERHPQWGADLPNHQRLELSPLSQADSLRLVDEILQKAEAVPDQLRELVVRGAEGNPFYVEELIKMLIEDGVILCGETHWQVQAERLAQVRLPPTLTAVLQARFDGLPEAERATLQRASVIGRTFWDHALAFLAAPQTTEKALPQIEATLGALRGREMIFGQRPSTFAGAREFAFKHALLRQATYESVLKRERRVYHARAAEWLAAYSGERAVEFSGLIAEHLLSANQTEQAAVYLRRAGEQAAAQFANAEALDYLSRALELTPASDRAEQYAILKARLQIYHLVGEREAELADLQRLEGLAADNPELACEVLKAQILYYRAIDDHAGTKEHVDALSARAKALGSLRWQAEAALAESQYLKVTSDYAAASAKLQEALALYRELQDTSEQVTCYCFLAEIAISLRQSVAAENWAQQALALCDEQRPTQQLMNTLWSLSANGFITKNLERCQEYGQRLLTAAETVGDRLWQAAAHRLIGMAGTRQFRTAEARQHLQQALALYEQSNKPKGRAMTLQSLGHVEKSVGNIDAAQGYYQQAFDIQAHLNDPSGMLHEALNLAYLASSKGDYAAEQDYAQQGLGLAHQLGTPHLEAVALQCLGDAAREMGRPAEAVQQLNAALALLSDPALVEERTSVLADLALAFWRVRDLPGAVQTAEQVLAAYPQIAGTDDNLHRYLWTVARVLHAAGQYARANQVLEQAYQAFQKEQEAIPEAEARQAHARMRHNRQIAAAYENNTWE